MRKYSVEVETLSPIQKKMTIRVPVEVVKEKFDQLLMEVQKTANVKGFRPGLVPLSIVKQNYGNDIRHQIFHKLIDETFDAAVADHQLKAIGRPQIDTPDHKTGEGHHDHTLHEDKELVFIATFDILPEIQLKNYSGFSLSREKVKVDEDLVSKAIQRFMSSHAELIPATSGLADAEGKMSSRPLKKGDFADIQFEGCVVTDQGMQPREDMKGTHLLEIGSNSFIPGFEEHLIGLRANENKTFRVNFPSDYGFAELAGKEAEFKVTIHDIKEKKLPELDDEFAKDLGLENVAQLREQVRKTLEEEKTESSERRLRSELLAALIEKNPFEVPQSLIFSQTQLLAQDWSKELKKQKLDDKLIEQMITQDLPVLRKRAESQVRASLILEKIADTEKFVVSSDEMNSEINKMAESSKVEKSKMIEFYEKNPSRREDLEFRLKQEKVIQFILSQSKIKEIEPKEEIEEAEIV